MPPPQLKLDVFGIEEAEKPIEKAAKPLTRKEKKEQDKFVMEMVYFVRTPWIVPTGYEDSINEKWADIRMIDVMKNQKQIFEKEVSSEFDAMIYISFCTNIAKPNHEASRIYEYLFDKFYDYTQISDYPAPTLDLQEHELLMTLRSWIFKRQMELLKNKLH